ncbi:hypothetical protein [Natrialba chahannaoensis]|nr:hypothetical protein [Natrialba chahannaoensis]
MPTIDTPSSVPVCTDQSEIRDEKQKAKEEQRPFVAVTNEESMPGWRVVYMMDQTGENRQAWYFLTEEAVEEIDQQREKFVEYMDSEVVIEKCRVKEGALHGLSQSDAKDLADRFADVVWDTDNWEKYAPRDVFEMS